MNTFLWFDDSLSFRVVQALLHFLWQGCAVAVVALLVGTTLKRASAHVRYLFYVAAMLVMDELAHIRRFDLLVNLLQRLAEAVLFFHPAVWFVSR
jgi:hypothetical protein